MHRLGQFAIENTQQDFDEYKLQIEKITEWEPVYDGYKRVTEAMTNSTNPEKTIYVLVDPTLDQAPIRIDHTLVTLEEEQRPDGTILERVVDITTYVIRYLGVEWQVRASGPNFAAVDSGE